MYIWFQFLPNLFPVFHCSWPNLDHFWDLTESPQIPFVRSLGVLLVNTTFRLWRKVKSRIIIFLLLCQTKIKHFYPLKLGQKFEMFAKKKKKKKQILDWFMRSVGYKISSWLRFRSDKLKIGPTENIMIWSVLHYLSWYLGMIKYSITTWSFLHEPHCLLLTLLHALELAHCF